MSGGAIGILGIPLILPLAICAAAPIIIAAAVVAAAVITVGGAAVLLTRGAIRGSEALAGTMVRLGDAVQAQEDRYFEQQEVADLWQDATALVMERCSRITALRSAARRAAVEVSLPAPLRLAGVSLADAHAWCVRVDEQLTAVRAKLTGHTADDARRRLTARLTRVDAKTATVAEALAGRRAGLRRDDGGGEPSPGRVESRVEEKLRRLDPDVAADDYGQILETAARATTATSTLAQRSNLDLLGDLVTHANRATRRRRDDALTAGHFLQAFAAVDFPDDGDGSAARTIARLTDVVDGRAELDAGLRADAEKLRRAAAQRAERRYLSELVSQVMTEQGFAVAEDAQVMRLTKDGWADHRVDLRISGRQITGEVVRGRAVGGMDAVNLDRERCAEFVESATVLTETLHAAGVRADVDIRPDAPVRQEDTRQMPPGRIPRPKYLEKEL
jgi:hypothetical protein